MSDIRPSPDVLYRDLEGQSVLLDLSSGLYFGLNEVGTRIWNLMCEGLNPEAIIQTLVGEFDADPTSIERDVRDLLETLHSRHLILSTAADPRL